MQRQRQLCARAARAVKCAGAVVLLTLLASSNGAVGAGAALMELDDLDLSALTAAAHQLNADVMPRQAGDELLNAARALNTGKGLQQPVASAGLRRNRRLHGEWQDGLRGYHHGRRLAQSPSVRIFSASDCRSVECGGQCCDTFYTYGSTGNDTCTQPQASCNAAGQCQFIAMNASVCVGMNYAVQAFPTDTPALNPTSQVGYACPSGADSECSYLNTFSSDMSACVEGACIPTPTGSLACVPQIRGLSDFGCATAVQTFTLRSSVGGSVALNTSAIQASAAANTSTRLSG